MSFWSFAAIMLVLVGQTPPAGPRDAPAVRLDFMKASLKAHSVHPAGDREQILKLRSEPVLRFTNTVGTVRDGAIFVWTGADDRPEAAVQVFLHIDGNWFQEFSSFSTEPIVAERPWHAARAGMEFKPIPEAPRPAATAEQRLRQIRDLMSEFSAEQKSNESWDKLRMLTKPFARYGKPGTTIMDGVLLACVLTTDPEVYLMLEARETKGGPEWQYAFAPASIAPLKGFCKKKEVWSLPYREAWTDNTAAYYVWWFAREP